MIFFLGGLKVRLTNPGPAGVDVELYESIGNTPLTSKMAYVVIEVNLV